MKKLLNWLRQPQTLLGLSAVGALVGIPPGTLDLAGQIVVGAVGLAGVFLNSDKVE